MPAPLHIERVLPTPRGVAAAVFAVGTALVATRSGNNLLHLVADTLIAAVIAGAVLPWFALRGVTVERLAPEEVFAGRPTAGRYRVRGGRLALTGLSLREQVDGGDITAFAPRVPTGADVDPHAIWSLTRRGWAELDLVIAHTRHPFGLVDVTASAHLPERVIVFPQPEMGPDTAPPTRPSPLPDLPDELRAWRPGDAWRDVHALVSARSAEAVVRVRRGEDEPDGWIVVAPGTGEALEASVRRATHDVLEAWAVERARGVRVGSSVIPPQPGPGWRRRALEALALFSPPRGGA